MFEHLRAFHYFMESGSFTDAALRMGRTRPNVYYHIKELERKMGVKLVGTSAGAELAKQVKPMVESYEALIDRTARGTE